MALTPWWHDAREDLRLGCRRLIGERGTTAAGVVVLASGIALSVAIFAIADTVVRRPLPVLDQQRLVVLWGEAGGSMSCCRVFPAYAVRQICRRAGGKSVRSRTGTGKKDSPPSRRSSVGCTDRAAGIRFTTISIQNSRAAHVQTSSKSDHLVRADRRHPHADDVRGVAREP